MRTKYERDIYLFLSLYRFFAYALAVVLIQVVPGAATDLGNQEYLLLGTVGVYTLAKVMGPLRWWRADPMTYIVLWGDLLVAQLALLLTGGLTSGFLLYSFLPVISAALLFDERLALMTAVISSATVVIAHVVLSQTTDSFVWVMEGNILLWMIFYMIASFLVSTSVYRTNLNIRQRIQEGAIHEERQRMRREIHDGVAQTLSYLTVKTDSVSRMLNDNKVSQAISGMEDMRRAVDETYKAVRESLDQLSVEVGTVPFTVAVEDYLKQFEDANGVHASLDTQGTTPSLSTVDELQILRIIQESLVNIRKYANAENVSVTLKNIPGGVELTVKDDGEGFDTAVVSGDGIGHHGLKVMAERAESLGGTFTISAAPNQGTEIRVFLPGRRGRGVLWPR